MERNRKKLFHVGLQHIATAALIFYEFGLFLHRDAKSIGDEILKARNVVKEVYMDEKIEKYILDIVFATRFPAENKLEKLSQLIGYGASPRASINLALASKAYAFIKRRGYVIPEDIRAVCHDILRHRIGLTYEAEAENITADDMINEILNAIEVP